MEVLWRGNANAWECDELGHLNVRFYLAKAAEAVGGLAQKIGMPEAFTRRASATLLARSLTVRFLNEVLPGSPLAIRGGVMDFDETRLTAVLIMDHCALGKPAAAFVVTLSHYAPGAAIAFPWSGRTRAALETLRVLPPPEIETRSLDKGAAERLVSLTRAERLGLQEVGRGMINAEDTDAFGHMRAEHAFGKISNSVVHFKTAFPEEHQAFSEGRRPDVSNAVLEARINFRRLPYAGTGYVIRSGVKDANEKVRTLVHWVCDPTTGQPLWTMEAVACGLNLTTRRLERTRKETLDALLAARIEGLRA